NVVNVVKATAEGLKNIESPEAVAARRGVSVAHIFGWDAKKEGPKAAKMGHAEKKVNVKGA
ncbi:MAG: 30S ribosomal protein S5, partial [Eggerthellaceae bacterium]|nr:30S ribosomal protein S5 [Eggerthellaceae bacterium]